MNKITAFLLITCATALAEPPVSSYLPPSARSNHPSAQYGTPSFDENSLNLPSIEVARATIGSRSQYDDTSARFGAKSFSNPSTQYGAPETDLSYSSIPSSEYGAPSSFSRSSPSTQYGAPNVARNNIPSNQYGAPHSSFGRSGSPSTEYGAPSSNFGRTLSSEYGAPSVGRAFGKSSSQYGASSTNRGLDYNRQSNDFSRSTPSSGYGVPSLDNYHARTPLQQYGAPKSSFSKSLSSGHTSSTSKQYNIPNTRLSTEYGTPSTSFGRSNIPSNQYGAPTSGHGYSAQGYAAQGGYSQDSYSGQSSYARGFSGDQNDVSEPANYDFQYDVSSPEFYVQFGHEEVRQGEQAQGTYHVILPDGRKQTVRYTADEAGFKPEISYEDVGSGSNGYGRSGADGYSAGGPY